MHIVSAQDEPSKVVSLVVNKIKKQGDPSPVVDYVYWDKIFSKLPQKNREVMNVHTPDELKEFYRKILHSPSGALENVLRSRMEEKLGADKTSEMLQTLRAKAVEKEKELKRKIKETEYIVGPSKIKGDKAKVPLTHVYRKEKKTEKVSLVKIKHSWLLEDLGKGFTFNLTKSER